MVEKYLGAKIWVIFIARTKMIDQGTDGISRSDINQRVMKCVCVLLFVTLHLSTTESHAGVKSGFHLGVLMQSFNLLRISLCILTPIKVLPSPNTK